MHSYKSLPNFIDTGLIYYIVFTHNFLTVSMSNHNRTRLKLYPKYLDSDLRFLKSHERRRMNDRDETHTVIYINKQTGRGRAMHCSNPADCLVVDAISH